jgi:ATP-dependent Lon protease
VRELERQIAGVMRKVAVRIVEGSASEQVRVTRRNLAQLAGKRRFERELAGREDEIGTATALAYTPEGGQILFVEGARMPGGGKIHLTGHLGGVMKESARAALSYLRSRAAELQIPDAQFDQIDLHVHIPGGATPKDGPSAGVALAVALASLFTGRPVRPDVAMTGELTLRGQVLPVGGVKEKLIAASEAGIRTVLVPARNEVDLEEVPAEVQEKVDFVLIERVADALDVALGAPPEQEQIRTTGEEQGPRLAAS